MIPINYTIADEEDAVAYSWKWNTRSGQNCPLVTTVTDWATSKVRCNAGNRMLIPKPTIISRWWGARCWALPCWVPPSSSMALTRSSPTGAGSSEEATKQQDIHFLTGAVSDLTGECPCQVLYQWEQSPTTPSTNINLSFICVQDRFITQCYVIHSKPAVHCSVSTKHDDILRVSAHVSPIKV